jgi:hypothetical protein
MRTTIKSSLCFFCLFSKAEEKLLSFINYLLVSWFLLFSLSWSSHIICLFTFYLWNHLIIRWTFTLFDLFIISMFFENIIVAICSIFLIILTYWKTILTVFGFVVSSYAFFLKSLRLIQLFSNLFKRFHLFKFFTFMTLKVHFEIVIIFRISLFNLYSLSIYFLLFG